MSLLLAAVLAMTPIADTGEAMIPRDDQRLYAQIIEAEAHPSWSLDGYLMLAQTVRNQLGTYGETYREVLTRDGNYSVFSNSRYRCEPSDNALIAVNLALRGSNEQNFGQLYFCTVSHLARNPNGLHGRSERVAEYRNVVFVR